MDAMALTQGRRQEVAEPRVAIMSPRGPENCETFGQAHINHLPGVAKVFHGGDFPRYVGDALLAERAGVGRWVWSRVRRRLGLVDMAAQREAWLARELKGCDVVLAEFGPTATAVARACRLAGVPLVAHFHGYDAYQTATLEREAQRYKRMFEQAAAVIGVSEDMAGQLRKLGCSSQKLHVIGYGIDLAHFRSAKPETAPPHFIAVGRFVEKKAPQLTLLAFARARLTCPAMRLTMAGDGPLLDACQDLAGAMKLGDAVEFARAMSHQAVAEAMRGARGFVQHSIHARNGDAEGTPVAILEASASGLPVVATRHMGIKQAVVDGITGFLVEEHDVDGMAAAMLRLAEDAGLAGRLGEAGRRHVSEHYTQSGQISRLAHVLRTAATGSGESQNKRGTRQAA